MAIGTTIATGASILLPMLFKKFGTKAATTTLSRVPAGMVVAQIGKNKAPQLIAKTAVPAGAEILAKGGYSLGKWPHLQTSSQQTSSLANVAKNVGKGVGNAATSAAPFALGLLGSGLSAGSTAVGAGLQAAANIPAALTSRPQSKTDLYGKTPMDRASDILSALGSAGNIAVSSIGNAAGNTVSDVSNALRLQNLQNSLYQRTAAQAQDLQGLNLNPSTANLTSQMLRSQGNLQHNNMRK